MADLKDTADQFAQDMMAMNIAGLMMAFTPNGMNKAMAMQQQMMGADPASAPKATGYEVIVGDEAEGITPVQIVLRNDDGQVVFETGWQDVAGAWKVEDISLRA